LQKHRLGTSLAETFLLFEDRMPSEDVSLLVRPLRAALSGGGNVVDLLEQIRDILRRKNRTKEKIHSMTAQSPPAGGGPDALPPSFAAVLSRIDRGSSPNSWGPPRESHPAGRPRPCNMAVDHPENPLGSAVNFYDLARIGLPILLGGILVASSVRRSMKSFPRRCLPEAYRAFHSRLMAVDR
jgi:hypothetical protein